MKVEKYSLDRWHSVYLIIWFAAVIDCGVWLFVLVLIPFCLDSWGLMAGYKPSRVLPTHQVREDTHRGLGPGGGTRSRKERSEVEEQLHFQRILNSFRNYKLHWIHKLDETIKFIESMNEDYQSKLCKYSSHLAEVRKCLEINSLIMDIIIQDVPNMFENIDYSSDQSSRNDSVDGRDELRLRMNYQRGTKPTALDMEKTQSVLRQLAREWTIEGMNERKSSFDPIIRMIETNYKSRVAAGERVRILVPGAGLGRLPFEIASRGYHCQGNEYSLFMLFVSNFVLNKCKSNNILTFCPWIHNNCNNLKNGDQVKRVSFPDTDPSRIPLGVDFSMTAGNFCHVYKDETNSWDCVATSFFLDTANNVVEYIDTIHKTLKPGGLWINFGPLLYHFADIQGENSIEPSYELLKEIITSFGFFFKTESTGNNCNYTQNHDSMLSYHYKCIFFVVEKPK